MGVFGKGAWALAGAVVGVGVALTLLGPRNAPGKVAGLTELRSSPERPPVVESAPVAPAVPEVDLTPAEAVRVSPTQSQPDQVVELATALEAQYTVDERPTREASRRETVIEELFAQPELQGKAALGEVDCRENICRGMVTMFDEQADGEVFGRTFLSPKFASAIQHAVTVTSRKKMPDGTVVATFFVHPQSVADMIPPP
ncbi:MAG: hypothetical protein HS104_41345 [Polyangiaceae bacterium]|nr:hypothetical protein [Polyangiaceae bacterium]MCL4752087.1 hypothetical protein [Myxococcales bacterium]